MKGEKVMKRLLSILLIIGILTTACIPKIATSSVVKAEVNDNYTLNEESEEEKIISQEYIDQIEYNSKENAYFGYTLSEVEDLFQGTPYVFTYDRENNSSTVVQFVEYDDTCDRIIKNVVIGSGVIVTSLALSAATSGVAPTLTILFSAGAKNAAISGLVGAGFGGIGSFAGQLVSEEGVSKENIIYVVKNVGLSASAGFKIATILGAISGMAVEASAQHKVAKAFEVSELSGLSKSEAIALQRKTGWPPEVIKQLHSTDEIKIYREANLVCEEINGSDALIREIDLNYVDDTVGKSNLELMKAGNAPIDPASGKRYELHHIGQKKDATLAILTEEEHHANTKILHYSQKESEISKNLFKVQRKNFWKSYAELVAA